MRTFGLIGKALDHSFSSKYFTKKFLKERISEAEYLNFEIDDISGFNELIHNNKFSGLNVTIPYKQSVIPFLDRLSKEAEIIGAVNTIDFIDGKLIGHNTDHIGFRKSIIPLLNNRKRAIILGNGGAARAIKYALRELNIEYKTVNRRTSSDYLDVTRETIKNYSIIINATPVGSKPEKHRYPRIPYEFLNDKNLLFDLIYNPTETKFLAQGKANNAQTKNGLEMLKIQAEESWNIWNL